MNVYNMKKNIFLFLCTALFFIACSEEKKPDIILNTVPPQPVTDVQVTNIPGGAILKYKLPDDEDLLYIKAVYSLNAGVKSEVRASLYSDTLKIQGFGNEDEREIEIFAVDRSKNESTPVKVKINPLEAPVNVIGKTLRLITDFGGVHAFWENAGRAEISIIIEKEDNNKEYVPIDVFYSTVINGDGASRGMDTIPGNFRVYVQDRWENKSTALDTTLIPLFETQFDNLKFRAMSIEGDEPAAWGWVLQNLFDGKKDTGFHTAQGGGRWPQSVTFDMGVKGQISRIKVWQRADGWEFRHGNLKRFEIWGTNDAQHLNDWSVWTKMMDCESIKPSGLPPGTLSDEDKAKVAAGEEFVCLPSMPQVRYVRLKAIENWSGGDFFHMMELQVFGQHAEK